MITYRIELSLNQQGILQFVWFQGIREEDVLCLFGGHLADGVVINGYYLIAFDEACFLSDTIQIDIAYEDLIDNRHVDIRLADKSVLCFPMKQVQPQIFETKYLRRHCQRDLATLA